MRSGRGGVGRDCRGSESDSCSSLCVPRVSEPELSLDLSTDRSLASSPLLPAESSGKEDEYISGEGLELGVGC